MKLADRMGLVDPHLLSANKRLVNLGLERIWRPHDPAYRCRDRRARPPGAQSPRVSRRRCSGARREARVPAARRGIRQRLCGDRGAGPGLNRLRSKRGALPKTTPSRHSVLSVLTAKSGIRPHSIQPSASIETFAEIAGPRVQHQQVAARLSRRVLQRLHQRPSQFRSARQRDAPGSFCTSSPDAAGFGAAHNSSVTVPTSAPSRQPPSRMRSLARHVAQPCAAKTPEPCRPRAAAANTTRSPRHRRRRSGFPPIAAPPRQKRLQCPAPQPHPPAWRSRIPACSRGPATRGSVHCVHIAYASHRSGARARSGCRSTAPGGSRPSRAHAPPPGPAGDAPTQRHARAAARRAGKSPKPRRPAVRRRSCRQTRHIRLRCPQPAAALVCIVARQCVAVPAVRRRRRTRCRDTRPSRRRSARRSPRHRRRGRVGSRLLVCPSADRVQSSTQSCVDARFSTKASSARDQAVWPGGGVGRCRFQTETLPSSGPRFDRTASTTGHATQLPLKPYRP